MLATQIEVQITCTCSVWGMQTTVESMMVAQAEESMQKFLAWARKRCMEFKQVWPLQNCALCMLEWCAVPELVPCWQVNFDIVLLIGAIACRVIALNIPIVKLGQCHEFMVPN